MKQKISGYLDGAISLLLFAVAGLTPLIVFNQTTEFYEIPKLVFLISLTIVLLGLWIFSWIVKGKIVITRTPLDIPLLLLLASVIVSSFFSISKFSSIYGNFPNVHGSAVAWTAYILLYFIAASHLKSLSQIRNFLYVLYASATVIVIISLLSFFQLYLPFDFARGMNFTTTGSNFATNAFLLILLPFTWFSITSQNKYLPKYAAIALSTLFSITVVLTSSVPGIVVLLIAFALYLFVAKPHKNSQKTLPMLLIPVAITVLVAVLAYMPFAGNKVQALEASFPKEIQLPLSSSWKISVSAFRDTPFFGTGPSTYLFDFTQYKPVEYNLLSFWNFSFDVATNEFLQVLGTLGAFGILALAFLCLMILINVQKNLSLNPDSNQEEHGLVPALAISSLLTVILFAVHATTLVSMVASLFILAAFMMSQKHIREKVMEFSMGIKASTTDNKQFDLFPIILFIVFLIGAVPALFLTYKASLADYYHRQALNQASKNGAATYQYLQKAETLNPQIDLYRIDLVQTNFGLANGIVAQKGPTVSNPSGSLTDADKQTVQTLLSQAVNEGRAAVTLNPRSARNWEILAALYRNISGVAQNALAFSVSAYNQAIQMDPINPALRLSVGGVYYSSKNYDQAIRYFTDAANLKPDYANAYYNLSIALRDKGDLTNAVAVAQQTVNLFQKTPSDPSAKTATQLLADLKAQLNNTSTTGQAQTAPAAKTNSALGNQNIPNVTVPSLNNPPQVTPAPAVKPNPNANVPQINPSPSVTQ